MNKPLKNSEWKSNCASSYYWITSSWKPAADPSSNSTLTYMAAVGALQFLWADTVFYLSVQFHCDYLPSLSHVGHFTALNTKKTWLGHLSRLLTLQSRWYPPEDTHRQRGKGKGKVSKPERRRSLCLPLLFPENDNAISYSVPLVIRGGAFPQGHGHGQVNWAPFLGTHLGSGLANEMPTIASLPPPLGILGESWGALGSGPVPPVWPPSSSRKRLKSGSDGHLP